jgi:hypothetical protein
MKEMTEAEYRAAMLAEAQKQTAALERNAAHLSAEERRQQNAWTQTAETVKRNDEANAALAAERGPSFERKASIMIDLADELGRVEVTGTLVLVSLAAEDIAKDERYRACKPGQHRIFDFNRLECPEGSRLIRDSLLKMIQPSIDAAIREGRKTIVTELEESIERIHMGGGQYGFPVLFRNQILTPVHRKTIGRVYERLVSGGVLRPVESKAAE